MKLDPRRRFRDRLLIAMVTVALLPLVAFAVLAAFDLDTIGRSTAEAAQGAILQDEQGRQQSSVTDDAGLINAALSGINGDLLELGTAVTHELAQASKTPVPAGAEAVHNACYTNGSDSSTAVFSCTASAADLRIVDASAALIGEMQGVRKDYPEVSAVWIANQQDTAMRVVPPFNVLGALRDGFVDPNDPQQHYRAGFFSAAQGRFDARNGWTGSAAGPPYWTDPYPLITTGATGISAWLPLHDPAHTVVGVDMTIPALLAAALPPSASAGLPPASYPLLLSSSGRFLFAGRGASLDFELPADPTGIPLTAALNAKSPVPQLLQGVLSSGQPGGPIQVTLGGTTKDIFVSPVESGRWVLLRPVPLSDLEPDLAGLTAGVTSGVRHLFPLVVLPALLLLLLVAFIVATVLSRRMVGPVRDLTVAAERLARGETDIPVPPEGADEVGVLAAALERMRREINNSRDAILAAAAELEGRVAQRTRELRARNDELVALNDLAGSLTRTLEPQWLLGDALQAVRAIHSLRAGRGYVLEGETLTRVADWPEDDGVDAMRTELDGVAALAAARGRPVRKRVAGEVLLSWPLATREGVVGALAARAERMPRAETRRLLQAVADQVALALRTSLLSAAGREHAVLEERTRLAREIHDTLAQQLTGIVIQLEAAETLVERGSARARDAVTTARDLARSALQEARRSVWNLRPAPLAASGLVAALEREARAWESRTGIAVRFKVRSVPARPALQPSAEVALLRALQEALSNVARHSGATSVQVSIRTDGEELVLSIQDNGHGFDAGAEPPRTDCFGLEGMRQRVRQAGGALTVMSSASAGTEITARVPLVESTPVAQPA